jgi:hypothetical protein
MESNLWVIGPPFSLILATPVISSPATRFAVLVTYFQSCGTCSARRWWTSSRTPWLLGRSVVPRPATLLVEVVVDASVIDLWVTTSFSARQTETCAFIVQNLKFIFRVSENTQHRKTWNAKNLAPHVYLNSERRYCQFIVWFFLVSCDALPIMCWKWLDDEYEYWIH